MLSSRTLNTSFEVRSLIGPELSNRLCWLGAPDISFSVCLPNTGFQVYISNNFTSSLGFPSRSSCLTGKCITKWTTSSARLFFIFFLYQKPNAVVFKTTIKIINIHLCWKGWKDGKWKKCNHISLHFSCLEHTEVNYVQQSQR